MALSDTDITQAGVLADRLLEAIRCLHITLPSGEKLRITASLGIAQWDGREGIQTLIERADQALYHAKHQGRNRVELAAR